MGVRSTGAGEKLQRTGALQDASLWVGRAVLCPPSIANERIRVHHNGAPASWSAAALRRFGLRVTIFRGAADGRGSSDSTLRRWCLQKEISASAIPRGRRKRPRWLCLGGVEGPYRQL